MKKNYTLVFLFFGLLMSNFSMAQIVAYDTDFNFGTSGGNIYVFYNTSVTLNGNPANSSQATVSLVSADNGLTLSGTEIAIAPGLATGTYRITYQVCEIANPSNCDTATITIQILCFIPGPIANINQPACNGFGSIMVNNLPFGNWTLTINNSQLIQGDGPTYFMPVALPGAYTFQVTDSAGCTGISDPVFVEPPLQLSFNVLPQTCDMPVDSVMLINLPTGNWTLTYGIANNPLTTVTGSGSNYTVNGLTTPGYYSFSVSNELGCTYSVATDVGYLSNGISGTMSAAYVDYNNDGMTNLGDIIQYDLAITNNSNCLMETVSYAVEGSFNPGTLTNLAALTTANVTIQYALTQDDINNGIANHWIALNGFTNTGFISYAKVFSQTGVSLAISDGIKLNAFFDTNNNGVQNIGELNVDLGNFTYQLNNNGVAHNLYSQNGTNIIYESNPANTYALSYNLYNNCTGQYDVSTISYNDVTVPTGSGITTYNFPITQSACQDVQVYLYGWGARPGFDYINYITFKNIGNQTMTSGTITFTKDGALNITSTSVPTTTTATGFTYNFTNLLAGEARNFQVVMQVPTIPTVTLGQLLTNVASITIPAGDVNAENNTSTFTQTIVGSYDPNDKTESHGGKIVHSGFTADDYLTYTIRFENTGTAEAINIRVNDALDVKLDETSIKMVKASHAYVLDRVGSNLTWRFDGVNLPPSIPNDEVTGHGYIVFQVKPKPGFVLGDIIPNTADIFFDFNPAIVTNTWTTEFVPFLGVNAFDASAFEYYPNPTSGIVTFHMKNTSTTINSIEVIDILGKTLLSKTVDFSDTSIDLSSLEKGIYLVKLKANGQEKTVKITKK